MTIPVELDRHIDEIITHYPTKRAPILWLCHMLQDHFGFLGQEQVEWIAAKLSLQPINVWEVVTFYPMFTQKPLGKFHIKVCRTLSCQLAGSSELLQRLEDLGADFTVSTVECLAACGTAPVLMINDHYDDAFALDASAGPLFRWLGTPEADKKLVVVETGHDIPWRDEIRETLDWLEKYLGPVRRH